MESFTKSVDLCAYLNNLWNRAVHCGLSCDDLSGLTGYRLKTIWGTLTGSERNFSIMCLRAIEYVVMQREVNNRW